MPAPLFSTLSHSIRNRNGPRTSRSDHAWAATMSVPRSEASSNAADTAHTVLRTVDADDHRTRDHRSADRTESLPAEPVVPGPDHDHRRRLRWVHQFERRRIGAQRVSMSSSSSGTARRAYSAASRSMSRPSDPSCSKNPAGMPIGTPNVLRTDTMVTSDNGSRHRSASRAAQTTACRDALDPSTPATMGWCAVITITSVPVRAAGTAVSGPAFSGILRFRDPASTRSDRSVAQESTVPTCPQEVTEDPHVPCTPLLTLETASGAITHCRKAPPCPS